MDVEQEKSAFDIEVNPQLLDEEQSKFCLEVFESTSELNKAD